MWFFKNPFSFTIRNKCRLWILILVFIIVVLFTVFLSIYYAADRFLDSYNDIYPVKVTIHSTNKNTSLTEEQILSYGNSKYVDNYFYTAETYLHSSQIKPIVTQNKSQEANLKIIGYDSYSAIGKFITGDYVITDGDIGSSFPLSSCLINEELAIKNHLEVGDRIIFIDPTNTNKTDSLKIIGLYKEKDSAAENSSANTVITTVEQVLTINSEAVLVPTYILKNMNDIKPFKEEILKKEFNESLEIQDNLSEVQKQTISMLNIKIWVIRFLFVAFIIGIVLIVILVIHSKTEIFALNQIGIKQSQLFISTLLKIVIVTFFLFSIGTIIGSMLTILVSKYLLVNIMNAVVNLKVIGTLLFIWIDFLIVSILAMLFVFVILRYKKVY